MLFRGRGGALECGEGEFERKQAALRQVFCQKGGTDKKFSLFQIKIFAAGGIYP